MTRAALAATIAGALVACSAPARFVSAQQIFQGGPPEGGPPAAGPFQGGPPPGGPQRGAPPRDARTPAQTGTAVVRGRVFAADTGRPLRRARILLTAPELGSENRATSTGADGRYEVKDLPAGRYTVAVNRSGYLRLSYGQRRPFELGKPLQVADRQVVENVDFSLPRMSIITGRVFDETGDPISGVRVFAMRSTFFEGRRRLVPVAGGPISLSDDAGQYRILGLPPGSYYVMADLRETWPVTEGGVTQVMGYAQTYFPGTSSLTDARRVTVGLGQEMSNTALALVPGRAASLSGTAFDSQGHPLVGRAVALMQEFRGPGFGMFGIMGNATVAADGTFRLKDLAPGEYKLNVRATTEIGGASVPESASAPIAIAGADIDSISLTTTAGWSIAGRVVTETGEVPSVARERIRLMGSPLNSDSVAGPSGPPPPGAPGGQGNVDSGRIRDDWTFMVTGLFGPARLRAQLPDGWMLKAIMRDGLDVTDAVLEMKGSDTLAGLDVVVTNRVASISGVLTDEKGAPATDGTIIVFSADAEKWTEDSRFVRSARPDQKGTYEVRGLPPADYLAVAVNYVEEGMWNDPEYLESIRRYGQKFAISEGGTQSVALRLVAP